MLGRFARTATTLFTRFAGVNVTYERTTSEGVVSGVVQAVEGQTPFRIDTEEKFNLIVHSTDWLIRRDARVVTGSGETTFDVLFNEPLRADRIMIVRRGHLETYTLLPFGDEPEWRPAGQAGELLRCHTKQTGRVAAA